MDPCWWDRIHSDLSLEFRFLDALLLLSIIVPRLGELGCIRSSFHGKHILQKALWSHVCLVAWLVMFQGPFAINAPVTVIELWLWTTFVYWLEEGWIYYVKGFLSWFPKLVIKLSPKPFIHTKTSNPGTNCKRISVTCTKPQEFNFCLENFLGRSSTNIQISA